jgi:sulfatase maturation enzyme AslB (radical SAM superfamily)
MKTRKDPDANYSAIFINGKTIRIPLDAKKPITELRFPEFYDISAGDKCASGKCDYCYASGNKNGTHYSNITQKVQDFFGKMTENQRPLQCAIGGEQEPLEHPEIWEMMEELKRLGITPNYTTNGVLINSRTIEKTLEVCGGCAVTLHMHLEPHWRRALKRLSEAGIRVNIHTIISNRASIDFTRRLYNEYAKTGMVEYFVLLPYMPYGYAINNPKAIDYEYFKLWLDEIYSEGKLAFGANFYNFIKKHSKQFNVSLYSPEIFSKYIRLRDPIEVSNNSFDKTVVPFNHETGCELGKARTQFLVAE